MKFSVDYFKWVKGLRCQLNYLLGSERFTKASQERIWECWSRILCHLQSMHIRMSYKLLTNMSGTFNYVDKDYEEDCSKFYPGWRIQEL